MKNWKFNTLFESDAYSIHELFGGVERGFLVPEYQRKYTWEFDNIDQLLDDIRSGVGDLSSKNSERSATFLGTVILARLDLALHTKKITSNARIQPTGVQIVIDGQQRISTISLVAIQLSERMRLLCKELPEDEVSKKIRECHRKYDQALRAIYVTRLNSSMSSEYWPKIIFEGKDKWGPISEKQLYKTPITRYIAEYIRSSASQEPFQLIDVEQYDERICSNIKQIKKWLDDICDSCCASENAPHGHFFDDDRLVIDQMQEMILGFHDGRLRDEIVCKELIKNIDFGYYIATLYCMLVFSYYFLHRCGINLLQPRYEDLGYDMFQSLNSTGVPLTAIETIRPRIIMNDKRNIMTNVDALLEGVENNQQKNSRINQFLSSFALCYNGKKLGNQLHQQRKWLQVEYDASVEGSGERCNEFCDHLSTTANFFRTVWYMDTAEPQGVDDTKLALLLVQYLKAARSSLSAPILARFFSQVPPEKSYIDDMEFCEAAKACAAFFTLWRSSHPTTSGLDKIYRDFFQGAKSDHGSFEWEGCNWIKHRDLIKSKMLKEYFCNILDAQKILHNCEHWVDQSSNTLLHSELQAVCRFVLFLAGHDRVADEHHPGLTVAGNTGIFPLLTWKKWASDGYNSLEHIAPQNKSSAAKGHIWADDIYEGTAIHQVGNLLLFPHSINNRAGNRPWREKLIYYGYIGCTTEEELDNLAGRAKGMNLHLDRETIQALRDATHNNTIKPILNVGDKDLDWDLAMIEKRTVHIKELAWKRLTKWLNCN